MIILLKKTAKRDEVIRLIDLIKQQYAEPVYVENENAISVIKEPNVSISTNMIKNIPCVERIVYSNSSAII